MKWTKTPPAEPGWYWYRDIPLDCPTTILRVDETRIADGIGCYGVEIERLPGEWWPVKVEPPGEDDESE